MGPGHVIALFDVLPKQPFQITLAKHDRMVKRLSTQDPDESLDKRILPRASVGGTNCNYVTAVQERSYTVALETVIVPEEIFGL